MQATSGRAQIAQPSALGPCERDEISARATSSRPRAFDHRLPGSGGTNHADPEYETAGASGLLPLPAGVEAGAFVASLAETSPIVQSRARAGRLRPLSDIPAKLAARGPSCAAWPWASLPISAGLRSLEQRCSDWLHPRTAISIDRLRSANMNVVLAIRGQALHPDKPGRHPAESRTWRCRPC